MYICILSVIIIIVGGVGFPALGKLLVVVVLPVAKSLDQTVAADAVLAHEVALVPISCMRVHFISLWLNQIQIPELAYSSFRRPRQQHHYGQRQAHKYSEEIHLPFAACLVFADSVFLFFSVFLITTREFTATFCSLT